MLSLLVSILVACIIFGLIYWIITVIPLPAPFATIARVVCAVFFAVWLIYELLGLTGTGLGHPIFNR